MKLDSLKDLFVLELAELYDGEQQLAEAFPDLVAAASATPLKEAFRAHSEQLRQRISKLHAIFEHMKISTKAQRGRAMEGLVREIQDLVKAEGAPSVKDAALVAAAQRIEHFSMAGFGAARTHAQLLGENDAFLLLQESLNEKKDANEQLTELAIHEINRGAASPSSV